MNLPSPSLVIANMTFPAETRSHRIPISSILSPQKDASPRYILPSSAAILGPLPPSSPIHLALQYIASHDAESGEVHAVPSAEKTTTLMITGPRSNVHDSLGDEDEEWLREHGGDYGVLNRANRINIKWATSWCCLCMS
jgi:hypothetical protein